MGELTDNLELYKPTFAETGYNDEIGESFDTIDAHTQGWVNVMSHGATGDGVAAYGTMTSGSAVVTAGAGYFAADDVGKEISVQNVGVAGAWLDSTIVSFQSPTQVTIADAASTSSVGNVHVYFGTDDSAAVTAAIAAARETVEGGPNVILFPGKRGDHFYLLRDIPLTSMQSIRFQGATSGADSKLLCFGDHPMFTIEKSAHSHFDINHLQFYGAFTSNIQGGVAGENQVAFLSDMAAPIGAANLWSSTFQNCNFDRLHYAIDVPPGDVDETTGMTFIDTFFDNAPMRFDGENALNVTRFYRCRWVNTRSDAYSVDLLPSAGETVIAGSTENIVNVVFEDCILESNYGGGVRARNTSPIVFTNCYTENNNRGLNAQPYPIFDFDNCTVQFFGGRIASTTANDTLQIGNVTVGTGPNEGLFVGMVAGDYTDFDVTGTGAISYSAFDPAYLRTSFAGTQNTQLHTGYPPKSGWEGESALSVPLIDVSPEGAASGATITSGTGDPETVVNGKIGAIYLRLDGAAGTSVYLKTVTGGSGKTGWKPIANSGSSAYTVTNAAADRAYDANATTLDELADVLGTLIADLKTNGVIT